MKLTSSLLAITLCIALLARAQAQEPTCPHQLMPIVSSVSVTGVPPCPVTDAPHTKFNAMATENFQGLVFSYSGSSQNCPGSPLEATIFSLPGECGGASNTGQPVVCGPTLYSDPTSPQEPSVTATLTFSYFNETEPNPGKPNVGPFSCEFVNFMSDSTAELSAANCPCPCPAPGPTLTFNPASPIISGTTTAIGPPTGFSYVSGTSTYTSSDTDAVTISATTAKGVAVGSSFISSAGMVYSPTGSYVATGCSVASTILNVTCSGSANFECADGGSPTCVQGTWGCPNGETPCTVPPPQGCYANGYQWECTPGGWSCVYVPRSNRRTPVET